MQDASLPKKQRSLFSLLFKEYWRQHTGIQLIASENESPWQVRKLVGSILTNKYAEGYPGKRYYSGNEYCDEIERIAIQAAKDTFNAEHANVQPHAGSTANAAIYAALLQPGDTVLALALDQGGHLTHGHPKSQTGKLYRFVHYHVDPNTETIDWNEVQKLAQQEKPKLILGGFTAYPRAIDFEKLAQIAHSVNALAMADISHIAGLVAAGLHKSPFPHCDVVMTTTHKTLKGPRGAIILSKQEHAKAIDSAVFPGLQGGPFMHVIAGKAWALLEAQKDSFKKYQQQVIANANAMAEAFIAEGVRVISGGTDTHLLLLDIRSLGLDGTAAANILADHDIYTNANLIPYDPNPPLKPSGLRMGTAWISARGYTPEKSTRLARTIVQILKKHAS